MRHFGVCTFFGRSYNGDRYGANGLPLTPSSVRILGRFQKLKDVQHPNLCSYLDFQRGTSERIFVISEHYTRSLDDLLTAEEKSSDGKYSSIILNVGIQLLEAVNYLHSRSIIIGCFDLDNVLIVDQQNRSDFDPNLTIKLTQYGLYYMTQAGQDVDFAISSPWYLAPEVFSNDRNSLGSKSDVWALGIILLECLCLVRFKSLWKLRQMFGVFCSVLQKVGSEGCAADALLHAVCLARPELNVSLDSSLGNLIRRCLMVQPSHRPTSAELLRELNITPKDAVTRMNPKDVFQCCNRAAKLSKMRSVAQMIKDSAADSSWMQDPLSTRPIQEVYVLWKLAGSSVERILQRKGLIRTTAPISCLPSLAVDECELFGNELNRQSCIDLAIVPLASNNLYERLSGTPLSSYFISIELAYGSLSSRKQTVSGAELPTVVKERSIEYQQRRMVLFERLVNAYPWKKELLWQEARVDIPPLYRSYAWAALLNVRGDVTIVYDNIDKLTVTPTDRQIEVDIPRCHQYDEILSSPVAHEKFKLILKAWVVTHPQFVYWQGLDSLCAPFLYLNFNNEALAYACLTAFIPRYLHKFFLKDNAAIIQEYLAVFSHTIAFHEPELYTHLGDIGFMPELYAIPWFLTMFAHVLPLHKLFHLWDTLLLGDSAFPLCVGVAILLQLKDRLMHFGFNECILLFSDLPEIDIERCVTDSVFLYRRTPKSAAYRSHAPTSAEDATADCVPRAGSLTETVRLDVHRLAELQMTPLTLDELRASSCPRVSARELLVLTEQKSLLPVLAVDVRPSDEFNRGAFINSVSIPLSNWDNENEHKLPLCASSEQLFKYRGTSTIVVIGSHQAQMSEKFYAVDVSVNQSRSRDVKHSKLLNVASSSSLSNLKQWNKRKNKNPLKTRLTVRELKRVIEQHKKLSQLPQQLASEPQVSKEPVKITVEKTKTSASVEIGAAHNPITHKIMPIPKNRHQQQVKREGKSKRSKIFDLDRLEIARFSADSGSVDRKAQFKIHFLSRSFAYDLKCDYVPLELRPAEGELPRVVMKYDVTIFIPFSHINGFHFNWNNRDVFLRLTSPPQFVSNLTGIQSDCELRKCHPSVQLVQNTQDFDVTDGNLQSLFHKLVLKKDQGALIQHSLLEYNYSLFEPLMKTFPDLINFGPTIVPIEPPSSSYFIEVGEDGAAKMTEQKNMNTQRFAPVNEDESAVMRLLSNEGGTSNYGQNYCVLEYEPGVDKI